MEITKVPVSFESDIYDESRLSYADKLIYTVIAEEINQYGEDDHVSSLSPEAATETQNMR